MAEHGKENTDILMIKRLVKAGQDGVGRHILETARILNSWA